MIAGAETTGEWRRTKGRVWKRPVDLFGAPSYVVAVAVHECCGMCGGDGYLYSAPFNPNEKGLRCEACDGQGTMPEGPHASQEAVDDPQDLLLAMRGIMTDDESLPVSSTKGKYLGLPEGRYVVGILPIVR